MPTAPKQRQPKAPKQSKDAKKAAQKADDAAKAAEYKKWLAEMETVSIPEFDITTEAGMTASLAFFDEHGVCLNNIGFETEAAVQAYCDAALPVMMASIFKGCHYKEALMATVPLFDSRAQMDDLTGPWKSTKTFKAMHPVIRKAWYPHCTFGAAASAEAFNCPALHAARGWDCLSRWATAYFDGDFAYPTLDRPIAKEAGAGESCFVHADKSAPWFRYPPPANAAAPPKEDKQVLGKLALSDNQTFIAVLGSHKQHEEMAGLYQEFYPNASAKHAKFALDPRKGDPLGMFPRAVKIRIPRGRWFVWNELLFHGVAKNPGPKTAFGYYLGFSNNIERAEYQRVTGVDEVQDRYEVWRYGKAPAAFPSCDKVHFLPYSFQNFPAGMLSYIAKCDPSDPALDFFDRPLVGDPTRSARSVRQVRNEDHEPPRLTEKQKAQTVGAHRVHEFDFGDSGNFQLC